MLPLGQQRMEQRSGAQPSLSSRLPWALLLCLWFSAGRGGALIPWALERLVLTNCSGWAVLGRGFFCSSRMVSLQQPQSEGALMRSSLSVGGWVCVGGASGRAVVERRYGSFFPLHTGAAQQRAKLCPGRAGVWERVVPVNTGRLLWLRLACPQKVCASGGAGPSTVAPGGFVGVQSARG